MKKTNEYYAKDISKKRRIVNKMKGNAGVPLSPPSYGYIKKPDDPRFWVVEPEAAEVVRRIYRMALEGYGLAETAAQLAADGVVNPTYYWRSRGTSRGGSKSTVEPTKWGHTTVKKILTLQEYCGDVINFKSYSKSYKMKKRIENPEENRAIFLNVHEAILRCDPDDLIHLVLGIEPFRLVDILISVGNAAVLGHLTQRCAVKQDTQPANVSPIRVKSFSGKNDCCLSEVTVLFFCADTHITPPVCKKIRPERSCSGLQMQTLRAAPFLK